MIDFAKSKSIRGAVFCGIELTELESVKLSQLGKKNEPLALSVFPLRDEGVMWQNLNLYQYYIFGILAVY